MPALEDAYADFEQDIEQLTAQRDNTTRNMAQVAALKAKLERVRLTTEEQVNALLTDFL